MEVCGTDGEAVSRGESEGPGALLTEIEAVTGLHRKHLVCLFAFVGLERRVRTQQRTRVYGTGIDDVIRVV